MKTGIYKSVTNEQYHADPAISSTKLKKLKDGTAQSFKYHLDNPEHVESDALLRGSLLHAMLLEPEQYMDYFIIESRELKDKTKLAKNGGNKEDWDKLKKWAENEAKPLVKHDIYRDCVGMRNSVLAHPFWINIANHGANERSLFAEIDGVLVKARYDSLLEVSKIIDLKTSRNTLTTAGIQRTIADLGYHFSAAMYIEVGKALGLDITSFVWVFVETSAPYSCRFVEASDKMLEIGKEEFYKCLAKFKECQESGIWAGHPLTIDKIDLPNWYANKEYLFESELSNV